MLDRETILVVEDEFPIRAGILDLLTDAGYLAVGAENGYQALQKLHDVVPDLIICDVVMPEMNGYQFYDRIRRDKQLVRIPFVFLTAKSDPEDVRYGKELGVDDYLLKPFEAADLLAVVYGKLRRFEQITTEPAVLPKRPTQSEALYTLGNLTLDLGTHQVWVGDTEIHLTPSEFYIMQQLFTANGKVVEYVELLDADDPQESSDEDASRVVRYHIRNLRQKLTAAGVPKGFILNIRSHGYRLASAPSKELVS